MKRTPFLQTFLLLTLFTISFSNCRVKPEFVDPMNFLGKWNIISYTIDDTQQLGNPYHKVSLNFGEIMEGIGPVALLTEESNGNSTSQGGEYSLSVDFNTAYITIDGKTIEYEVKFNEDHLRLLGSNEDNQAVRFEGEKE